MLLEEEEPSVTEEGTITSAVWAVLDVEGRSFLLLCAAAGSLLLLLLVAEALPLTPLLILFLLLLKGDTVPKPANDRRLIFLRSVISASFRLLLLDEEVSHEARLSLTILA